MSSQGLPICVRKKNVRLLHPLPQLNSMSYTFRKTKISCQFGLLCRVWLENCTYISGTSDILSHLSSTSAKISRFHLYLMHHNHHLHTTIFYP